MEIDETLLKMVTTEEKPMETEEEKLSNFFQVGREMWDRASKVYELVDNFEQNRDKEEIYDEYLDDLKNLSTEIKQLQDEKEKLIQIAIGYMYNGVLVSGDISCRKGKVYRFRCQYKLNNASIKKAIMNNLQEVEKKLSTPNLEILETLLEFVGEKESDSRYSYNQSRTAEKTELSFPKIRVAEFDRDNGIAFKEVDRVTINDEGSIEFSNDEDSRRYGSSLDRYTKFMLKAKMKNELKTLSSEFVEKQTIARDELVEQVSIVKSKASNLLMLSEIDNQPED